MAGKLIVVCGPTASGKTKLGIELCKVLDGEVVSADSMQIYRGMDIGTAKPTKQEQQGIPHHMLSVAEPGENYSAARYVKDATACVEDIFSRGKQPILVGGTGLYLDALCKGQDFAAYSPDSPHRVRLQEEAAREGLQVLWHRLQSVDPESAQRLHPNDEKRVIRALEVYEETGKTISEHNRQSRQKAPRYDRRVIGLNYQNRDDLRTRIDERVEDMVQNGLMDEVSSLLQAGVPRDCTAMQAIGYKELLRCIDGQVPLEQAVEDIKLRSRQYAKRQLTWFRRMTEIQWIIWEKTPNFSIALQNSISFLLGEA